LQEPLQYGVAPLHATPQAPQFIGLFPGLTHWPPQQDKPLIHDRSPTGDVPQPPPLEPPEPLLPEPPLLEPEAPELPLLPEPLPLDAPELIPLELPLPEPELDSPPLPPASVDASAPPPVAVIPPHCDANNAPAPSKPSANADFD
jgi:hypothetical protein